MKKKKYIEHICYVIFSCYVIFIISYVLKDKSVESGLHKMYSTSDKVDVVFCGPSSTYFGISPLDLYHDYGIKSINISTEGQAVSLSYYSMKEMFKYQSPKVVFMDVSYADMKDNVHWMHATLNYMKNGMNRFSAITSTVPRENWMDFFFPITLYHSTWENINKGNFSYKTVNNYGGAVEQISVKNGKVFDTSVFSKPLEIIEKDDYLPINDRNLSYYKKMIDLCQEHGAKLVFISLPSYMTGKTNHGDGEELQKKMNYFYQVEKEYDVEFINCLHHIDEMDFDFVEELCDWRHPSVTGNIKITSYIGKYLIDHYSIEDRRNEDNHNQLEKEYKKWNKYRWEIYSAAKK